MLHFHFQSQMLSWPLGFNRETAQKTQEESDISNISIVDQSGSKSQHTGTSHLPVISSHTWSHTTYSACRLRSSTSKQAGKTGDQPRRPTYRASSLGLSLLNNAGFIMFQYTAWTDPPTPHSCLPLNQDRILGQAPDLQSLSTISLYSVWSQCATNHVVSKYIVPVSDVGHICGCSPGFVPCFLISHRLGC